VPLKNEAALLFAFDLHRALGIFGRQLPKLLLRFGVVEIVGVLPTFRGLISQIDGTL
jgi:hypothetical protein